MLSVAYLSPASVAAMFGCKVDKVLTWIASRELIAINVATSRNGDKPRWRITPEALADFERSRTTQPKPLPTTRRIKKNVTADKEYF